MTILSGPVGRRGYDVTFAAGEVCCGALVHHVGCEAASLEAARRNVEAWVREMDGEGFDAIVITASGFGTTIKDYGFMLRDDPVHADKASRVSAIAKDVSEVLIDADLPAGDGRGLTVAYHAACSLQHGQKVTEVISCSPRLPVISVEMEPVELLARDRA